MIFEKLLSSFGKPKKRREKFDKNSILNTVSGLVHVGANRGQEIKEYALYNLDVIWVEPIPEVFAQLSNNIKEYPKQAAFQALITDVDDKEYQFHIADNNGASSSIFQFKEHKEIWPSVHMTKTIPLKSKTLATLFKEQQLNPGRYQGLVMDTQGSELLVLKGSLPLLKYFRFVYTEVADFEAYAGCCRLDDVHAFMAENGFREYQRKKFARPTKNGGQYYNVTYVRKTES